MLLRFLKYLSHLRTLFGLGSAVSFMFFYLLARARGDREGMLHYIPVGPYVFYFPLTEFFAGLFNEIFFNEAYYVEKTDAPLRAIDAGANIGLSLLYLKLQAPNARVTCIEPNPAARAVLKKNIEANGWGESVDIIPCALGKSAGTADFFVLAGADTDSSGSLTEKPYAQEKRHSFSVSVEPLSRYLTDPVDFLKLDIEGAEFDVLEDLRTGGCFPRISQIQLEYHDEPGFSAHQLSTLLQLLEGEGFKTAVRSIVSTRDLISRNWRRNCMIYAWRMP